MDNSIMGRILLLKKLLIFVLDNGLGVGGVPELCFGPSLVWAYYRNSSL
jgi:hypothetical protein